MSSENMDTYIDVIKAICRGRDVVLPMFLKTSTYVIDNASDSFKRIREPSEHLQSFFSKLRAVAHGDAMPVQKIPTWIGTLLYECLSFTPEPEFVPVLPSRDDFVAFAQENANDLAQCFKVDGPDKRDYQYAEFRGDKIFSYAFTGWLDMCGIVDEKRLTEIKHYYENTQTLAEIGTLMGVDKLIWGASDIVLSFPLIEDCTEAMFHGLEKITRRLVLEGTRHDDSQGRSSAKQYLRQLVAAFSAPPFKLVEYIFNNFQVNLNLIRPDKTMIVSILSLVGAETKRSLRIDATLDEFKLRISLFDVQVQKLARLFGVDSMKIDALFNRTYTIARANNAQMDTKTATSILYSHFVQDIERDAGIDVFKILQAKNAQLCENRDVQDELTRISVFLGPAGYYLDIVKDKNDARSLPMINIRPKGIKGRILRVRASPRVTMSDLQKLRIVIDEAKILK